jgi:hypothetical protein
MYACIPEIGLGFFEVVCAPRKATVNFRDPPPPRRTKTGASPMELRPEEDHQPLYRGRRFSFG